MVIIVLEYSPSAILMPEKSYSSIIGKFPLQSFSKLLACFTVSRGIVFFFARRLLGKTTKVSGVSYLFQGSFANFASIFERI